LIVNTIEAGADLGGGGAYLHSALRATDLPHHRILILRLQIISSHTLIRNIFRVNNHPREITGQKFTQKSSGHGLGLTRG
jgi:hypothetical protein